MTPLRTVPGGRESSRPTIQHLGPMLEPPDKVPADVVAERMAALGLQGKLPLPFDVRREIERRRLEGPPIPKRTRRFCG